MTRVEPFEPVTLDGRYVRLEPLGPQHFDDLADAGLHPELWRWTTTRPERREDILEYLRSATGEVATGTVLPFATILRASGKAIGSTRYAAYVKQHRRLEIGWTWITPAYQRTSVNTEAKYLMFAHAFEKLGCMRVELKTDSRNEKSRRAILRIGAREEGTFRNHMINPDGSIRHTVYFSVIDAEWPGLKVRLERMMLEAEQRL